MTGWGVFFWSMPAHRLVDLVAVASIFGRQLHHRVVDGVGKVSMLSTDEKN